MLTEAGCKARRELLWERLPESAQWVLIADPRHVLYFSNFLVNPICFARGERGLLLLERSGKATLLADNFARKCSSGEPFVDDEVIEAWYDHKHAVINRDDALFAAVKKLDVAGPGAVEAEACPVSALAALGGDPSTDVGVGSIVRDLRRVKHEDELALMRQCMAATNAGHARAREVIAPGVSELDVYREVQSATVAAAGTPGIVYGDFRMNTPDLPKAGGLPTDAVFTEGNLFILDYSCVLHGYRSDFTNTYAIGDVSDRHKELFAACAAALSAGRESVRAGVTGADVYNAASKPLTEAGFPAIPHHAGHGLGQGHPEPPILVPASADVLRAGDVVTIEPGAYVEGLGGVRVEHNLLVTDDGSERLDGHTIEL
ncbi:MAG: Xaa-Pro peptidase family protein [Planctomycetota bacterium]